MDHSVTARYSARPVAHFVRHAARARAPRLGLRPAGSFRAAAPRATVLREPGASPLTRLLAGRRAYRMVAARRSTEGSPRPAVAVHWSHAGRPGSVRRTGVAISPWHG